MGKSPLVWFLPIGSPDPECGLDYDADIPVFGLESHADDVVVASQGSEERVEGGQVSPDENDQ